MVDQSIEAAVKILAQSSVKRRVVEQLREGAKTPSELATILATKLPNITAVLRDLKGLVYQANPGSTKGKVYVLSETGYEALSALEDRTTRELVSQYASRPSNYRGRVIRSSTTDMTCIFNFPIRQWDFISGRLRHDTEAYTVIGIVTEVQIRAGLQVEGGSKIQEQTSPLYMTNILLLGTLSDQHITSQTPLLPAGSPVNIALEEEVKEVLSTYMELSDTDKTIIFGRTVGRPHFSVALGAVDPVLDILIGDIPRRTQIAVLTKIIKDIISKPNFERQSVVFCFTRKPGEFKHLDNRLIKDEQEFQTSKLDCLFKEYEEWDTGKLLIVDFSSFIHRDFLLSLDQLIKYLVNVNPTTDEFLKYLENEKAGKVSPAVSIVIDEADTLLVWEEHITDFEDMLEKGRSCFDNEILVTQSPFQSTKILRSTSTLLLGSKSIRNLDILNLEHWGHMHFLRNIMKTSSLLADSDYMFFNKRLNFPVLLTLPDSHDVSEMETAESDKVIEKYKVFHKRKGFPSETDREILKKLILIAKKEMEQEGGTMKHTGQLDDNEKERELAEAEAELFEKVESLRQAYHELLMEEMYENKTTPLDDRHYYELFDKVMEKDLLYWITKKEMEEVSKNVVIEGATMKHKFDLGLKNGEEIYLVRYEKIDGKNDTEQIALAQEWVFPTIDIGSSRGKFIFVYDGDLDRVGAKILQHYYNVIVPIHNFKEFLRGEVQKQKNSIV
jgi:hypothetical protein